MCDFCRHTERHQHRPWCMHDEPNARADYDAGWLDGRRGRERRANSSKAYDLGYGRGESALEDWENSDNWYGM